VTKAIKNHCLIVRASSDITSAGPHCQSIRVGHWRYSTVGVNPWRRQLENDNQSVQMEASEGNEEIKSDIKEFFYEYE